jgi:hypothetical protein
MESKMIQIKVGYCLAYDWELLKISLPLVYPYVDKICLSLDEDRISWSGNRFSFDEQAFHEFIRVTDVENKIILLESNFHSVGKGPMANEVFQRNKMAEMLGRESGWHIQLDVDEYPCDMEGFTTFLRESYANFNREVNICLPWITLFKQVNNGFLIIKTTPEWIQIASTKPFYVHGRRNGYFNYKVDYPLLHQSWARGEKEIENKVKNWGHSQDYDAFGFFQFWKNIDESNYQGIKNFHPEIPRVWESLVFMKASNVQDLILNKQLRRTFKNHSPFGLWFLNSKLVAKIRQTFGL